MREGNRSFWASGWGIVVLVCLFLILSGMVAFGITVWQYKERIEAGGAIPEFENAGAEAGNANDAAEGRLYPGRDDNPSVGPEDAEVEVIFFEDFQCPVCAQLFPVKRRIMDEYGDRVIFVFRHFPIESLHDNSLDAARAAECANEQGAFWVMHDKLFQNQADLAPERLKSYAREIGLNGEQFDQCLDSGRYDGEIGKDVNTGALNEVGGTPTFFVNGEKFEGVPTEEYFRQLLDFYLDK